MDLLKSKFESIKARFKHMQSTFETLAEREKSLNKSKIITSDYVECVLYEISFDDIARIQPGTQFKINTMRPYDGNLYPRQAVKEIIQLEAKKHVFFVKTEEKRKHKNRNLPREMRTDPDDETGVTIRIWKNWFWFDTLEKKIFYMLEKENMPEDLSVPPFLNNYFLNPFYVIQFKNLAPIRGDVLNVLAHLEEKDNPKHSILCHDLNELVCQYLYP